MPGLLEQIYQEGCTEVTRISTIAITFVLLSARIGRAQDVAIGEAVFGKACLGCHGLQAGVTKIGPSLANIVGRKAGSSGGTPALRSSDIVWSRSALVEFLQGPRQKIPGVNMTMELDQKTAEDVVEFLSRRQ